MQILLLGRDGQLGWELMQTLPSLGELAAFNSQEVDVTKTDELRRLVRKIRPDLIVNAAAYTDVDKAESEPEIAATINEVAPSVLAEEINAVGGVLLHFSSDYVFDGTKGAPYVETDFPNPLGVYGRSKLAGELAIQAVGGAYIILRTSWMYSLHRRSFISKVLNWARSDGVLKIVSDQTGSPTWSKALARAVMKILTSVEGKDDLAALTGLYHLAGEGAVSRVEWAEEILRLDPHREEHVFKKLVPVKMSEFPTPACRPAYSALENNHVRMTFGVSLPPWQDSLREAMREPLAIG